MNVCLFGYYADYNIFLEIFGRSVHHTGFPGSQNFKVQILFANRQNIAFGNTYKTCTDIDLEIQHTYIQDTYTNISYPSYIYIHFI